MTLSYGLRVFCLLTVVGGLVYASVQLVLAWMSPLLLHKLDDAGSRLRERLLYLAQIAPTLVAVFIAWILCLPEYLWHEPTQEAETIGWLTLVLVAAVCIWFGAALCRGLRMTICTVRFARACRNSGRVMDHPGATRILALAEPVPPVCLVGFVRPFILISEKLLEPGGLNPGALQAAIEHERAHISQFDNWKMLSISFLPRLLGDPWRRSWQLAADCAADEDAACGDAVRSLLLAEALVRTARLVKPSRSSAICAALTRGEAGLAVRVQRLLDPPTDSRSSRNSLLFGLAGVILFAAAAAVAISPWVYSACEMVLHLGGF